MTAEMTACSRVAVCETNGAPLTVVSLCWRRIEILNLDASAAALGGRRATGFSFVYLFDPAPTFSLDIIADIPRRPLMHAQRTLRPAFHSYFRRIWSM